MGNLKQLGPTAQPEEQLDPPVVELVKFVGEQVGTSMIAPGTVFRAGLIDRLENLRGEMAEEPLVYGLIDTQGKYESHQDRAKAIIKRLRAKK